MVKVSVIIPVFNVENYLEECLDSIINQVLDDLEIICVNDGSTDNSLNILNNYQIKDSRIKIINQENNGAASARNKGIAEAKGEYVYLMDSDDILELSALDELYQLAEDKNLDLVIFKLINFKDGTDERYTSPYYEMTFLKKLVGQKIFNYRDIGENFFNIAVSPPGKFFKNDLIHDIKFPEGYIFEDNVFFTEVMLNANSVYFLDQHLYNRRVRSDSITGSTDIKQADIIPIFNLMIDLVKKYNCYNEFKAFLLNYKISIIIMRFGLVEEEYKNEFFKRIKKDFQLNKYDFEDVKNSFSNKNRDFYEIINKSKNYTEFKLTYNDKNIQNMKVKQDTDNISRQDKDLAENTDKNGAISSSNSGRITQILRNLVNRFNWDIKFFGGFI